MGVWLGTLGLLGAFGVFSVARAGAAPVGRSASGSGPTLAAAGRAAGVRVGFGVPFSGASPLHQATVLREADVMVNHELSWSGIEPSRGVWDFTKADRAYQFGLDHHLFQIGFHFAWDQQYLDDLPDWVTAITDPAELRAILRERAHVIFTRYPRLDRIDVINEPFVNPGSTLYQNHFYRVLGPDYIDQLFQIVAAEAPASTQLIVNETGLEYQPAKAAAVVALVRHLRSIGARIGGVGFQTHMVAGEPNWLAFRTAMEQVAALGVTPFVSELDVPVPATVANRAAVQAARYRHVVETCLMVPACDTVNTWGVSDLDSWYNSDLYPGLDPLLFDASYQPKPAYFAVRDALLAGRIPPGPIPAPQVTTRSSGDATVVEHLECRPTGPSHLSGYGQLAELTQTFVEGNPVRLDLPVHLTWPRQGTQGGTAGYAAAASLDLSGLARSSVEESAKPVIGLGGHLDLVDTVWIHLRAAGVVLTFGAPPGTAGPAGVARAATASGDSRTGGAPTALDAQWVVSGLAAPSAQLPPPVLQFELTMDLGVVVGGTPVPGTVTAPMACHAVGDISEPLTTVVPAALPVPARPLAPVAPAVIATPRFAG